MKPKKIECPVCGHILNQDDVNARPDFELSFPLVDSYDEFKRVRAELERICGIGIREITHPKTTDTSPDFELSFSIIESFEEYRRIKSKLDAIMCNR